MCNTYQIAFSRPLFTGSLLFNHVVIGNVSFDYKSSEYLLITPSAIHFLYEKKKPRANIAWLCTSGNAQLPRLKECRFIIESK